MDKIYTYINFDDLDVKNDVEHVYGHRWINRMSRTLDAEISDKGFHHKILIISIEKYGVSLSPEVSKYAFIQKWQPITLTRNMPETRSALRIRNHIISWLDAEIGKSNYIVDNRESLDFSSNIYAVIIGFKKRDDLMQFKLTW